ncbi:helicase C-terminal domain-containing protein [Lactobacillus kalixensis]|uniref:3'-5' exonuclease DinG n=1 Tax=Lactobacillus kalixensis DSM 16043 TaxID=1423763 RepID=A0A0R1UB79_9LACO|nr:helicase C-terminal domain-containing protein [Lactobacillus kalixensis]KRL90624.1 ATP-dependent DNA helicase [Lactobacillus kalixensis DSM 16043]
MSDIFAKNTFAVVDLETTGTQKERDNHIIQFGCAIVKHMKVVKTYSFMINPHREIPLSVQNLTGIHDEDVKNAKDFSYYAPKIIDILKDTVFVAHNVNFDLPFLNYELVQHGYEALTNRAIDTVELAKIAFPTLPSYKLSDLTDRLDIKHLNPHKADSDAYGTAILLIDTIRQLETLPQATLNTLSSLSSSLVRDTSWIFSTIADYYRQSKRPLSKEFMQVRNIILQKQEDESEVFSKGSSHFPQENKKKKEMFKGHLHYRKAQVDLINHLHNFILDPNEKAMLVEAPNGTGKTFSYLFSYAYQLYSGRKLVVATPTNVLQDQILGHEIPQLLEVTGLDLKAEVVKSSSHYIDLDGFVQSLFNNGTPNKPTLVLQMQILVWLTQTKTGDMDELQLTNYNNQLFTQISHPGDARVGSRFSSVDFWNLARKRQEEADILVTNHAYLANHYMDTIWGQNPYLVIDEAHRFTDNVISSRNDALRFESLWGVLSHLRNLLYYSNDSAQNQFTDDVELNFLLKKLNTKILELIYKINELQKLLYSHKDNAINDNLLPNGNLQLSFQSKELFPKNGPFLAELTKFEQLLEEVRQDTNQILFKLYQEQDNLFSSSDDILSEIAEQIDRLDYYAEKSYQLADLINGKELEQEGFILVVTNPEDPLSTNLHWIMLDVNDELKQIYDRFDHICFVSATMTVNDNFEYAINKLNLEKLHPITYIGKSTFDFKRHLQVLAVKDMPSPDSDEYEKVFEKIIVSDILTKDHILILMTNLDKIRDVFSAIVNDPKLKDFEILAQGLSGSNQRIAKRFGIAKKAIILGADSFWEGIDFHKSGVDLVIAAKLPFESPDQPEVRLRQKRIEDLNLSVFQNDSLPRAIIRFRQGIGRLIRGEHDYGQFVILDSRLWSKNYGKDFITAIPVKTEKITIKELKGKLDNYDQRRHKTNH